MNKLKNPNVTKCSGTKFSVKKLFTMVDLMSISPVKHLSTARNRCCCSNSELEHIFWIFLKGFIPDPVGLEQRAAYTK